MIPFLWKSCTQTDEYCEEVNTNTISTYLQFTS